MSKPLVSILVPNYNYGMYLRACFDSILAQTYENMEILFSDNASTDDSFQIARTYQEQHPDRFHIWRHERNIGPSDNAEFCKKNCKGDYIILFGSDDIMKPDYVERCVGVLERYRQVGLVVVARDIVDEHGNVHHEAPFYERSCLIPGKEQAAVFMMGGVCSSTQVMYRAEAYKYPLGADVHFYTVGDWLINFVICCRWDLAFISDPLMLYRMHGHSETNKTVHNMIHIFEQYLLFHTFDRFASTHALDAPRERLQPAIEKLSLQCLRYCRDLLFKDEREIAAKYFHLSKVFNGSIENEPFYRLLHECVHAEGALYDSLMHDLRERYPQSARRQVSYAPPGGSVDLESI